MVPLKKPTKFVSSDPQLIAHVRDKFCASDRFYGKVKSSSEVWPLRLCRSLACGIADLILNRYANDAAKVAYPTFSCPGCRNHIRKDDPRHVRDETCKFKDEVPSEWTCPACVRNRQTSF